MNNEVSSSYINQGYRFVYCPNHPRANNGYISEHTVVVEKALGRPMPKDAVVHHVNEDRSDNSHTNLVICQDRAFHFLLHQRMRVQQAGGNPNTDKLCCVCKILKVKTDFSCNRSQGDGLNAMCRECRSARYVEHRVEIGIYNAGRKEQRNTKKRAHYAKCKERINNIVGTL
jgi:hypothetical protein